MLLDLSYPKLIRLYLAAFTKDIDSLDIKFIGMPFNASYLGCDTRYITSLNHQKFKYYTIVKLIYLTSN
jgi:hypothetical protein